MNLVINSQFRPFTYDEMVKPLVQYKEVYDQLEQGYSNLAAQTEMWRDAAIKGNNPIAYNMFNKYATDLEAITEDFSKGLNPSNRRALLGMKRRYASEVEPISKASKKIEELSAEQRKLSASNPDLMYDRDFSSDVSIDQMIENPSLSYRAVDGKDLYNKGQAITKAMASRIHQVSPALRNQYFEIRQGFGEEAANQFLVDSGAIPELNTALEGLVNSSGVTDKNRSRALEYARQGAISGMVSSTSYQANRGYESPAQYAERMERSELRKIQSGAIPYRTDSDGTKRYYDSFTGKTWGIDKEGNIVNESDASKGGKSKKESGITQAEVDRMVAVEGQSDDYRKDPNKANRYYKRNPDTDSGWEVITKDDLPKASTSDNRIKSWNARMNNTEAHPVPVLMAELDGDGKTVTSRGLEYQKDLDKQWRETDKKGKTKIRNYTDLSDDMQKVVNNAVKPAGLTLEDIIIQSQDGGLMGNERIRIIVRPIGGSGESTSNNDPNYKPKL